jgi:hypothetical protein
VDWPGGDGAILAILAFLVLVSLGLVSLLRQQRQRVVTVPARTGGR